ncbi:hypothetical protein MVES_002963 [Malassezia vespertilionis]|uniref:Uncharacterized protein n=2 Tax=Malassezia vespertilionis TaxID=2020962 RepID=A0A2N1J951_9BASI|nr:hypothetical protein MVES_002963 [Malassezia vespertilionis]
MGLPMGPQHAYGKAYLAATVEPGQLGPPVFSHLQNQFPLRLLTPHAACRNATITAAKYEKVPVKGIGILYVVGFGGGLVSGDHVDLEVDVGSNTRLLLLTQGSTKVFRERRGGDPIASLQGQRPPLPVSEQYFRYIVRPNATLVLLPSPVTCFARSRYMQTQRIDLRNAQTCSLVLLDWFTAGRLYVDTDDRIPELWHFFLYHSRNEVRIDGEVVLRDRQHLEQDLPEKLVRGVPTELSFRCIPYKCYGMFVLYGIECAEICEELSKKFDCIEQPQPLLRSGGATAASRVTPQDVLWSVSPLCSGAPIPGGELRKRPTDMPGIILRFAGIDMDTTQAWLRDNLK